VGTFDDGYRIEIYQEKYSTQKMGADAHMPPFAMNPAAPDWAPPRRAYDGFCYLIAEEGNTRSIAASRGGSWEGTGTVPSLINHLKTELLSM
jgi:hypothetical protein